MNNYGVGALIVNNNNEILLILRGKSSRNDQWLWSQPGGAIESDQFSEEIIIQNIKREVVEEIGININIIKFLTITEHSDEQNNWRAYSYLAEISDGTPKIMEPDKHEKLNWFDLNHLPPNLNQVTLDAINTYKNTIGIL